MAMKSMFFAMNLLTISFDNWDMFINHWEAISSITPRDHKICKTVAFATVMDLVWVRVL